MGALRAEVTALARLVQRDTAEGGQVMDQLQVKSGYEKALGAALADDLRAPRSGALTARRAGRHCPDTLRRNICRRAFKALSNFVTVPAVLARPDQPDRPGGCR